MLNQRLILLQPFHYTVEPLSSPQTEHGPDLSPIPRTPNEVGAIIIHAALWCSVDASCPQLKYLNACCPSKEQLRCQCGSLHSFAFDPLARSVVRQHHRPRVAMANT
jgi:hypothetical protein